MSMNHPGLGVPEREELINTHTYTRVHKHTYQTLMDR